MGRIAALVLLAAFTCPAAVVADGTKRAGFENADTDDDSRVSYAEFRIAMERHFEKRATAAKRLAAGLSPERKEGRIKRVFARLDTNGDGSLDAAEWNAGVKQAATAAQND